MVQLMSPPRSKIDPNRDVEERHDAHFRRNEAAKRRRAAALADYERRQASAAGTKPYDSGFTYGGLCPDTTPVQAADTFSGGGGSSGGAGASSSYDSCSSSDSSSSSSSSSDSSSSCGGGE